MKNFDLVCSLYYLWKIKAPPRVIAFGWVALRGNILTQDNLHHWKMVMVNACPTCLSAKEAVDLFLIIRSLKKFGDRCLAGLGAVGISTFPNWSFSSLKIFYWVKKGQSDVESLFWLLFGSFLEEPKIIWQQFFLDWSGQQQDKILHLCHGSLFYHNFGASLPTSFGWIGERW